MRAGFASECTAASERNYLGGKKKQKKDNFRDKKCARYTVRGWKNVNSELRISLLGERTRMRHATQRSCLQHSHGAEGKTHLYIIYIILIFKQKHTVRTMGRTWCRKRTTERSATLVNYYRRKRGECEKILVREQHGLSFWGKKTTTVRFRSLQQIKATGPRKMDVVSVFATVESV